METTTFTRSNYITHYNAIQVSLPMNIGTMMDINESVTYIDGTKIEAYANKYSFVYKTRILNARTKMFFNITEDVLKQNISFNWNRSICF